MDMGMFLNSKYQYVSDTPTIIKTLIEMKSKNFSDEEDNLI